MTLDAATELVKRFLPQSTTSRTDSQDLLVVTVPISFVIDGNEFSATNQIGNSRALENRLRAAASEALRPGWLDDEKKETAH